MHNMRAEQTATQNGTALLWHVLDRDGRALCGQPLNSKSPLTPDGAIECEAYCRLCMKDVTTVVDASLVGTPPEAQRGGRQA